MSGVRGVLSVSVYESNQSDTKGTMTMAKNKMMTVDPRSYAQSLVDTKLKGKQSAMQQFEVADEATLAELFADYDMEPPIAEVQEGQMIRDKLTGPGSPVETASPGKDPKTGQALPGNILKTWTIDIGNGVKVRILSGHQLDTAMPPLVGRDVVLVKGKKTDLKGGRTVREWLIGSKTGGDQ